MLWLIASHTADTHRCSLNQSSLFLNNKHLIRNLPLFILECSACLTHNMSKSLTQDIRVMCSAPPLRPQTPTWWTATCGENELPLLLWQLFHLNKNHYKEETAAASVDTWTDATTPREGESGWNTDRSFLIHRQPAWCTYVCVCVCACLCAGRVNHSTRPIISCGFCSILYWQHKKGSEKEDNRTTWWHSSACYSVFGRLSFVSIKKDLKRRKSERFVLQSHRRYFTYTLQLLASFMYDKQTHF